MRIGINCGHTVNGSPGSGAMGFLSESDETRAVGYKLKEYLRSDGHTVVDCTNDRAASTAANLKKICSLANAQPLDAFISIHFNAGGGMGSEVFTYGSGDVAFAGKMKSALYSLGFKDRGIKDGSNLYVIRNTNAPASLVEVCFVDTKSDAELYRRLGADKVARALAEAITGKKPEISEEDLTMSQYEKLKKQITELTNAVNNLTEDVNKAKPVMYNYIDDNMPDWARPTIKRLVDKGYLKGDEEGLRLTEEAMRILVVNDRAGLYA